MKSNNNVLLLASLSVMCFLTGCGDADGTFSVRRESIDVGQVNVGDSVSATFTFKNNSAKEMTVSFIPECDCTTINLDNMRLGPRKCGQLEVKVAVNKPGEFIKYVYAQTAGNEDFITVAVKGRTK